MADAGTAAKVLMFFIIVGLVGVLAALPGYYTARDTTRTEYETQYAMCMQQQPDEYVRLTPREAAAYNACTATGGCYVSCGSACGNTPTDLTFSEYLQGGRRTCPIICTPGCLRPPAWTQ